MIFTIFMLVESMCAIFDSAGCELSCTDQSACCECCGGCHREGSAQWYGGLEQAHRSQCPSNLNVLRAETRFFACVGPPYRLFSKTWRCSLPWPAKKGLNRISRPAARCRACAQLQRRWPSGRCAPRRACLASSPSPAAEIRAPGAAACPSPMRPLAFRSWLSAPARRSHTRQLSCK